MSEGGYREAAHTEVVPPWTQGKCPWRPGWWRRFMWLRTKISDVQSQEVRKVIGGTWVRVAGRKYQWYPVRPPFEYDVDPLVYLYRGGTPLEFEEWKP